MERRFSKNSVMTWEFDWVLTLVSVALAVFGLFAVYSATRSSGSNTNIIVQSIAVVIGTVVMLLLCFFDYEQFIPLIKYIFLFCAAFLLLVLLIGFTGKWGSKSWIRVAGISIQPSELVKCGFIITLSYHLSQIKEKINRPPVLFGLLLHLMVPTILILMQPDFGTAVVFVFIFCIMLFSAKLSFKYIIPTLIVFIAALPVGYHFLDNFQKDRIRVFFNPELDPLKRGYNVIQSKIAVGSGELYGKGYLSGPQNQMGYLPAKHTDFIFSSIAEEFGFIGAALVIAALFIIIIKCVKTAKKADNLFGRYICIGAASMLFFHTVENIGMCMGLLPVTGIPLPFLSYGGTSIITNFACIGLVLSVSYHNKPRSTFDVY
ncbi:MAG: rod shape-determining protein RodA [Clostridia bacterium]|nr:rod shape-determining protein RodA [Clostridia bacterium]